MFPILPGDKKEDYDCQNENWKKEINVESVFELVKDFVYLLIYVLRLDDQANGHILIVFFFQRVVLNGLHSEVS